MKFKLQAGAEIDLASPEELHAEIDRLCEALAAGDQIPTVETVSAQAVVTAGGVLGGGLNGDGAVIYEVPTGRVARIVRLTLATDTHTPAAPLAAGWIMASRNKPTPGTLLYMFPGSGGLPTPNVLPAVVSDGTTAAAILRSSETLRLSGAGLPANLTIGVLLQLYLDDITPDASRRRIARAAAGAAH